MALTKNEINILFVALIILVLGFMIFTVWYVIEHKEEMVNNPFSYGVKKQDLGQCTLTCFKDNEMPPLIFYINSTSFSQQLQGR